MQTNRVLLFSEVLVLVSDWGRGTEADASSTDSI